MENTQQDTQRLPNITPQIFGAMNTLEGFVAKAALTRQEHSQAQFIFQEVLRHLEGVEALAKQVPLLKAEVEKLKEVAKTPTPADKAMVENVIEKAFQEPKQGK